MASLFSTAITGFCASVALSSGHYNEACNKAMDAGTRQLGWRQNVDRVEDKTTQYANTMALAYTPKPIQDVFGAAGFIYRSAMARKLSFRLPTLGVCSSANNEISPEGYTLNIKWNLP